MLEESLVWILGSGRSGSTWLLRMLGTQPGVATFDEPGFGLHVAPLFTSAVGPVRGFEPKHYTYPEFNSSNPDYFLSPKYAEVWRPALRELILNRLAAQLAEEGRPDPSLIVIKEPGGSHAADMLMALMPRARLLFLIRDGRDVVDSGLDASRNGTWFTKGVGNYEPRGEDRLDFVRYHSKLWLLRTATVQRAYEAHAPELRLKLRYEDLLDDTPEALGSIVRWLGLDIPPERLEPLAARHSFKKIPRWRRGEGRFFRAATPGLWRENLSADEQRIMHEVMGPKLAELGYAV